MAFGGAVKLTGESEYKRALNQITQNLREVSSQMVVVSSAYDKNDKSMEAISAKAEVLNKKYAEQKNQLSTLKAQYASMQPEMAKQTANHDKLVLSYISEKEKLAEIARTLGTTSKEYKEQKSKVEELSAEVRKSTANQDANEKSMSKMRVEINKAEADCNSTARALDNLGKEAKESGDEAKGAGEGFTVFKGVVADLASKAIQSAISGLKQLGSALINVGKQAVSSYAEYEQLVGGVETMFKDSAGIVEGYADQAYKTAGLSANEYMEQVTSFSASLLQSLGQDTKAAAEYGNMAVIDMSDNANKMGTSIGMIQNAYQGFAKQNYTMLDNLKLGYGGTKKEMERLIKDANRVKEANGEMADLSIESFGDVVEAIHIIQTEMGITGTTSAEAADTISGSAGSVRAAWQNLLTGIADDNANMSKLVDNFINSVITSGKNLVPRIKNVVDGIKKLAKTIVTEVFPKLKREIPELAPLIETFEWFTKHRSAVVGSIQAIVASFVAKKIWDFTKSMSDGVKAVANFVKTALVSTAATEADTAAQAKNTAAKAANTTADVANTAAEVANTTAKGAGTVATGALTVAQKALNAAMSSNPIGLVVAALGALVAIIGVAVSKNKELTESEIEQQEAQKAKKKELEQMRESIQRNVEAYDDLVESQQKAIDSGMSEISHYSSLWDELQGIVDQNGKIKKGYEERASFIASTLSEAMGTEIEITDGVVKKYSELKDTIDEVMEKKRAQIILDSQETMYKEAINNQAEAMKNLSILNDEMTAKKKEMADLDEQLAEAYKGFSNAKTEADRKYYTELIDNIANSQIDRKRELAEIEKNYNAQRDLVSKYIYDIGIYESNLASAHAGNYDQMSTVTWEFVKDYQNADDAQKAILEDQIKYLKLNLAILEEEKKKSGSNIYDQQIKDGKKQLEELERQLKAYTKTTENNLEKTAVVWSDQLDDHLSEITGRKVEFRDAGEGLVQMVVDGVEIGEPKAKEEMAKLTEDAIKEITDQEPDAKAAGENLIEGVNNGIKNQNKQSSVFKSIASFGASILSKLKASLKEKSPSKATNEMGRFLLEGLGLGIENEEDSVLKQVSAFGRRVISGMNAGLSGGVNLAGLDIGKPNFSAKVARQIDRATVESNPAMVEAFKTALSEMKIELDDEVAGRFVEKTVARAVYSY